MCLFHFSQFPANLLTEMIIHRQRPLHINHLLDVAISLQTTSWSYFKKHSASHTHRRSKSYLPLSSLYNLTILPPTLQDVRKKCLNRYSPLSFDLTNVRFLNAVGRW